MGPVLELSYGKDILVANLINLENVDKSFGLKTLLKGVSLGIQTGDRIGGGGA